MKYILIFLAIVLTGCSTTVPVVAKFPDVPKYLLDKCPPLKQLNDDDKLSDISKTITLNYTQYYECSVKNDAWIEWYQVQKHIFEGLK
jgi:hypothetical protein